MAHCIVIDKELSVDICPLEEKHCVYKHRLSGVCKADQAEGLSVNELARLVGAPPVDEETYKRIYQQLNTELKGIQ